MTDFIVDFPNRNSLPQKSVQIATMTQIQFVKGIEDKDVNTLWYSKQDYKAMRAANKQVVLNAHMRFAAASSSSSYDSGPKESIIDEREDDICLNAIENLLTPSAIKRTRARIIQCVSSVLFEQDRQYDSGIDEPKRLACISLRYSAPASKQAQKNGYLQSIAAHIYKFDK